MHWQDLVQLTNGDPSSWLAANLEMNKSLGLELLENVLNSFPRIFHEVCTSIYEKCTCFVYELSDSRVWSDAQGKSLSISDQALLTLH